MNQVSLTPLQRLFLAFVAFFAVLLDRRFAEGVKVLREREHTLPPGAPLVGPTPAAEETITVAPTPAGGVQPGEAARPPPIPPPPLAPLATPPTGDTAPAAKSVPPAAEPTPTPVAASAPAPVPAPVAVPAPAPVAAPAPAVAPAPAPASAPAQPPHSEALHVLALLQRDGRLVDFVSEDLTGFSNAEIGAAARTVHEGCRKVIDAYIELEPVYREPEGASVTVGDGFDPASVRLTGNVVGSPPFKGSLRHHGWRVKSAKFPPLPPGGDVRILAPAEVEL